MLGLRLDEPLPLEGLEPRSTATRWSASCAGGLVPRRAGGGATRLSRAGGSSAAAWPHEFLGDASRWPREPRDLPLWRAVRLGGRSRPAPRAPGDAPPRSSGVRSLRMEQLSPVGARSCGEWSRSTSQPASPSARRCLSSAQTCACRRRPSARSSPSWRRSGCSCTLTRPPAASPPRAATASMPRSSSAPSTRVPTRSRSTSRRSGRSSRQRSGAPRRCCRRRHACSRSSRRPRSRRRRCGTSTCSSCSRAPSSSS